MSDPNLIPTIGGLVLLASVWISAIAGRAYVRGLQRAAAREEETPPG